MTGDFCISYCQTSSAISLTKANLAHCSSAVNLLAIGGDIQKITDDTIVAAPANIDIAKDITGAAEGADVGTEVFAWLNKYNQRGDFQ